jgi:zinc protease
MVSITFAGAADYSIEERMKVRALTDVINIKIIDELREKLTLIYGGGMGGDLQRAPYPSYQLGLTLPCAPDKVEQVVAAALGEIRKIQERGADPADLAKVQQNWLVAYRKSMRENQYWLGQLQASVLYNDDFSRLLDYEKRVMALTTDDIKIAAKRYLPSDNYVQVVLLPEQ